MFQNVPLHMLIAYILSASLAAYLWMHFERPRHRKRGRRSQSSIIREIGKVVGVAILGFLGAHLAWYFYQLYSERPFQVFAVGLFFALIPSVIWMYFVYEKRAKEIKKKRDKRREAWVILIVFILGALTVPMLSIYYEFIFSPQNAAINYYHILGEKIVGPYDMLLRTLHPESAAYEDAYFEFEKANRIYNTITIVIDALLEEIVKLSLLIFLLRSMKLVNTIGDAITFSILSGLGFAFTENIVYFADIFEREGSTFNNVFMSVVVFRSIVLSIGHMTFSGIFGYFYGLSKFARPVYEEQKWEGFKYPLLGLFSKVTNTEMYKTYAGAIFYEGMILAMVTHAMFNTFLSFGARDYAVYLVLMSALYVYYLTQRKSGHLILANLGKKRMSLMAPKDEDVVLELAGMWINEGKYKEVEEICERLEAKDPDNAVIKLLYARAHDKRRVKRAKLALASLFFQEDIFEEDVSIFEKWKQIRAEREKMA